MSLSWSIQSHISDNQFALLNEIAGAPKDQAQNLIDLARDKTAHNMARQVAIARMRFHLEKEAVPILRELLDDENSHVRSAALSEILAIPGAAILDDVRDRRLNK